MPKKRRSDGRGNVVPTDSPERYEWRCKEKGCGMKGKVHTKKDVQDALTLHMVFVHGRTH